MLLLFAFAALGQSPHYWVWLAPFAVLVMGRDRRLVPLHCAQCALLAMYSIVGGSSTAGYLLGVVSPDFFWSLPSPTEMIGRYMPVEMFVSLAHTALSAVTLYMAFMVFQKIMAGQSTRIQVFVNDGSI